MIPTLYTIITRADLKIPDAWVVPHANKIRMSEGGRSALCLLKPPGDSDVQQNVGIMVIRSRYSECGPWTSCVSTTWELVRNARIWTSLLSYQISIACALVCMLSVPTLKFKKCCCQYQKEKTRKDSRMSQRSHQGTPLRGREEGEILNDGRLRGRELDGVEGLSRQRQEGNWPLCMMNQKEGPNEGALQKQKIKTYGVTQAIQ